MSEVRSQVVKSHVMSGQRMKSTGFHGLKIIVVKK